MQFKALLVVPFAGLAIASPTPAPSPDKLADRIKAMERNGTKCRPDRGITLCDDFQGSLCTIGKNGNGGACLF